MVTGIANTEYFDLHLFRQLINAVRQQKPLKAFFLAGVFISFLMVDAFAAVSPVAKISQKSSFGKAPEEILILRDSGSEGTGCCLAIKTVTPGYTILHSFELLISETAHQSILFINPSQRNVFYVFVSSLAP